MQDAALATPTALVSFWQAFCLPTALLPSQNLNVDVMWLFAADQVLKLPAGKYTVREREMMTGSGVPAEFFHATSALGKTVLIGASTVYPALCEIACCAAAIRCVG